MTNLNLYRYVARIGIEFETPFHVGTGREGAVADASVVTDANGLPAIPGSSLAGAIRAAYAEEHPGTVDQLFGFPKENPSDSDKPGQKGQGSRLTISWAAIHDSQNRPVTGIASADLLDDPILTIARQPILRDHVRLNHRGVAEAEDRGKFDELCVQAGHRFTFELELTGTVGDQELWQTLLQYIFLRTLRLGGKTRRGFGQFKVIASRWRAFNLQIQEDFAAYADLSPRLAMDFQDTSWHNLENGKAAPNQAAMATLELTPHGYWMFGGGTDDVDGVDMAPLREDRVVWKSNLATILKNLVVIPASSIKGALSHRVAFHYNRLMGNFADKVLPEKIEDWTGENNPAVRMLFGWRLDTSTESGQRGRVILNDAFLEVAPPQQIIHHVSIDRFTGGALPSALFEEKPFWQGPPLLLKLVVVELSKINEPKIRLALDCALRDLAEGRLALGAGAGRGLGFFTATKGVQWNETGAKWLSNQ